MKGKWFVETIVETRGYFFFWLIVSSISRRRCTTSFCIQDSPFTLWNVKISMESNIVTRITSLWRKPRIKPRSLFVNRCGSRGYKNRRWMQRSGQVTVSIAFRVIYEWTALACNRRAGVGCLRAFPCVSSSGDATEKGGSRIGVSGDGILWSVQYVPICRHVLSIPGPWPCCLRPCQTVCSVCLRSAMRDKPSILLLLPLSFFLPFFFFFSLSFDLFSRDELNEWQFHEVDDRGIIGLDFFVRVEDAFVFERRAEYQRRHVGLGKLGETWGVYVYGYRLEGIVGWGRLVINQIN